MANGRENKDASLESCSFAFNLAKIQRLPETEVQQAEKTRLVLCYLVVSLIIVVLIMEASSLADCIIWPLFGCQNRVHFWLNVR